MKKMMTLSLLFVCVTFLTAALAPAQEEGFVSLFNGKDLTGWDGDAKLWSVVDGAIVGETDDADRKITYNNSLAYNKPFEDFVLRFDFRISDKGNSGFYYRGWYLNDANPYQMGGYQADFDGAANYSGIVYGEALRGILANLGTVSTIEEDHNPVAVGTFATAESLRSCVKTGDWNSYEVYARENCFVHMINGQVMSVLHDEDDDVAREEGLIGIQLHVGPPMKVEVKNIRIKELHD
ncbi:MAG: DUF1080 domain-containing protein [Planctomycetia bacterium]|nr:DUF1080 domain-containing protein [Planctomycetia bacterium]